MGVAPIGDFPGETDLSVVVFSVKRHESSPATAEEAA
jgi:hypothetical protein